MQSSFRVIPSRHPSTITASVADQASDFGVHDTFRYGFKAISTDTAQYHPLERHLEMVCIRCCAILVLSWLVGFSGVEMDERLLLDVGRICKCRRWIPYGASASVSLTFAERSVSWTMTNECKSARPQCDLSTKSNAENSVADWFIFVVQSNSN